MYCVVPFSNMHNSPGMKIIRTAFASWGLEERAEARGNVLGCLGLGVDCINMHISHLFKILKLHTSSVHIAPYVNHNKMKKNILWPSDELSLPRIGQLHVGLLSEPPEEIGTFNTEPWGQRYNRRRDISQAFGLPACRHVIHYFIVSNLPKI